MIVMMIIIVRMIMMMMKIMCMTKADSKLGLVFDISAQNQTLHDINILNSSPHSSPRVEMPAFLGRKQTGAGTQW